MSYNYPTNSTNMYGTRKLSVVKFIVQRAGTYNAQYRRPYSSHVDQATRDRLLSVVENKKQITAPLVARFANDLIMPGAVPEQTVNIAHGWHTPRLRFLLEMQMEDHMGSMLTTYINGYTEFADVSHGGLVNPQMPFYVNNIATLKRTQVTTPVGNQTHLNLIDSSQVLTNTAYQGALGNATVYSMRPENIIGNMEIQELSNNGEEMIVDTTAHLSSRAILNKRSNNIAPSYIASTLDSYLQAARGADTSNTTEIYQSAGNASRSLDLTENAFINAIMANRRRTGSMLPDNFFTLDELISIDSNARNCMNVVEFGGNNMHQAGSTQEWHGSDGVTMFATALAQALPGYMSSLCINRLHFRSTNRTLDGSIVTTIANIRGYNAADLSSQAQALIHRFNHELLMSLSYGNKVPFSLDVNCDFLGETWIEVALADEPLTPYVFPTFCDSLMAPIVTHNQKMFDGITSDFSRLVTDLVENDSTINRNRTSAGYLETGSVLGQI